MFNNINISYIFIIIRKKFTFLNLEIDVLRFVFFETDVLLVIF